MLEQLTFRLNEAILFDRRRKGLHQLVVLAGLSKKPENAPFVYSFYRRREISLTGQYHPNTLWKSLFSRGKKLDSVH